MPKKSTQSLLSQYDHKTIERALMNEVRTTHALFFHRRADALVMTTAHPVDTDSKGNPMVGPGHPLTPADEQELLDLITCRDQSAAIEILPEVVLYQDKNTIMWWLPPKVRPMHLRSHVEGFRTITTQWPSLVALVRHRTLHLVAVEGSLRPTASTMTFHAPLPNVYGDSRVCTGSAELPLSMRISDIEPWESVVFDTAFTHTNHQATLRVEKSKRKTRSSKSSIRSDADAAFWTEREGFTEPFPDSSLNPLGLSLVEWLSMTNRPRERSVQGGVRH